MSKLKVGLVLDDSLDKPDGVQQYVLILGRWLSAQGHHVHYLVGETKRTDLPNIHSLARNIKVSFNKNRMAIPLPANLSAIRELLAREQFDVLHVQVPYSPALAGRIIASAGPATAVVGTFHILPHSKLVTLANRALSRAVARTLKRFDIITSNTKATAVFAKQTFGIDGPVIPLPLELRQFIGAKPFARYKQGKTVMFLGRLVERKGCQYLLQAVSHAVSQGVWPKDARVVVCGAGHMRAKLERYVKTKRLDDMIEFTGMVTEEAKPRYLASADVVAYPSTGGESFGIVLLEAMAASPGMVLAGDNPGYASVMAPRPRSLFDPHDIPAFSKKLVQALQDTDLRASARDWQRDYIHEFDVPVVGKRIVSLYQDALALHKHRS
jgi:phosphatidylinositol alpha-mannosyltransferase